MEESAHVARKSRIIPTHLRTYVYRLTVWLMFCFKRVLYSDVKSKKGRTGNARYYFYLINRRVQKMKVGR